MIDYRKSVSVWEIILIYAVTPALIVAILGALTVGTGWHRAKVRYEPGKPWDHDDRLWAGVAPVQSAPPADRVGASMGGAHASW